MQNEMDDWSEAGLRVLQSSLSLESISNTFQDSLELDSCERLLEETTCKVSSWVASSPDHSASIVWLTGLPNRSSLQEVVELCKSSHQFAAVFSFSSRKGAQQRKEIFLSLAYQIAMNIPSLRSSIGLAMFQNPEILSTKPITQFSSLFLAPFDELDSMALSNSRPVVIIDAIELYHDRNGQESIISIIEIAVTSQRLPLRFIFTSQSQMDYTPPFHSATHIRIDNSLARPNQPDSRPVEGSTSLAGRSSTYTSRGFPKLVQTQYSIGGAESYTRSLMMLGHGIPLWYPQGYLDRPLPHIKTGVCIGDVLFVTADGKYEFFFNIFCDPGDPIQKRITPGYFKPIYPPLNPTEVTYSEHYFKSGMVITSPGVSATTIETSPLRVHIESKRQEGATLVLPKGGSREDLVSTHRFHKYIKKWAPYWYNLMPMMNGSLFLVTGCDKVSDYAAMCFPYDKPSYKNASPPVNIDYIYKENHDYSPWRIHKGNVDGIWHNPDQCELPFGRPWPRGNQSLCIFVRGMRIALGESTWAGAIGPRVEVENEFYTTVLRKTPPLDHATTYVLACLGRRLSEPAALDRLSIVRKRLAHPIFLLGPVILGKYPSATMALVDDAIWCPFVNNQETGTFDAMNSLVDRVLEECMIIYQDGIILVTKRSEVDSPEPIDDTALSVATPNLKNDRYGKPIAISQYATELLGVTIKPVKFP